MNLRLYDWGPSPFCLKIRAILDYKGLDYERVPVMAGAGSALLDLRRRGKVGKVPALDVDGRMVVDSTDIAEEIERLAPEPTLYPSAPRDRALSHTIEDWADESLYFVGLYYQWVDDAGAREAVRAFRGVPVGALVHRFYRRRIVAQAVGQGIGRKSPAHVARDLDRHLDAAVALIDPGPFLFGERPMLADFALMAQLVYLSRTPAAGSVLAARPAIGAWLERFKALRRHT